MFQAEIGHTKRPSFKKNQNIWEDVRRKIIRKRKDLDCALS